MQSTAWGGDLFVFISLDIGCAETLVLAKIQLPFLVFGKFNLNDPILGRSLAVDAIGNILN